MPIFVSLIVLVLDQLVKAWVQSAMHPGMSIPVIPAFFHITFILNPGAAFGILANQRLFFIGIGAAMLLGAGCFYSRLKQQDSWIRYGAALLLGGAVGNLLDRIRYGVVVDFLDFRVWPVFNIADIAIVFGVGCIVYALLFRMKEKDC